MPALPVAPPAVPAEVAEKVGAVAAHPQPSSVADLHDEFGTAFSKQGRQEWKSDVKQGIWDSAKAYGKFLLELALERGVGKVVEGATYAGGAILGAIKWRKAAKKAAGAVVEGADEAVEALLKNKPKYSVNVQHAKGPNKVGKKTPLPADAEKLFENAIPHKNDKTGVVTWWAKKPGKNDDYYRYFEGNDGTAHFSGIKAGNSGDVPKTVKPK